VFVATDNRAVLETFEQRFPGLIHRPKWYPERVGDPIHGHRRCPDKLRMAEDALVDLLLLGRCSTLIYSGLSSFGRYASAMAQPRCTAIDVEGLHAFRTWHGRQPIA
jgi:hypothetical protein